MGTLKLHALLAIAVIGFASNVGMAHECQDQYYSPEDYRQEQALAVPHSVFKRILRGARSGDSVQQRSMAVLYESGYLVSRCLPEAVKWYAKAAESGDEIARKWIEAYEQHECLRSGPEMGAQPQSLLGECGVDLSNFSESLPVTLVSCPVDSWGNKNGVCAAVAGPKGNETRSVPGEVASQAPRGSRSSSASSGVSRAGASAFAGASAVSKEQAASTMDASGCGSRGGPGGPRDKHGRCPSR